MVAFSVTMCSTQTILTLALLGLFLSGSLAAQADVDSQDPDAPTPFPVCIDDSDCQKLGEGNKYACFQYLCYPWKEDSHVPPKDRRRTCRTSQDCEPHQQCMRHHDKRNVFKGICFDEIKSCSLPSDCSKNYGCCGGSCCEMQYYEIFKGLPCISHMGCQDLGLGRFCCPPNTHNNQSHCCNIDPNPPTTPYPMPASALGAANRFDSVTSMVLVSLILAFQQIRNQQ